MTTATAPVADGLPGTLAQDLSAAALAVARRFSAGATMWCVSPPWPQHAAHVAVEFVHPVVVGTRALPAVAVPAQEALSALPANVQAGDLLVLAAPADDPVARRLARRAAVWGACGVWLGCGPAPEPGAADHVLWLPDDAEAPFDGRLVLLYHLLWELTHVCFEHPGLLAAEPECTGPACVTCADEGRLAEVLHADGVTAQVRTATGVEGVDVTLVAPVSRGDLLLVHAGAAVTLVDDT